MTDFIKKLKSVSFLAVLYLLMACGSALVDTDTEEDIATNDAPKIAFVSYKISKDATDKITIELIDVLMAKGKLKPQDNEKANVVGDYELIQLSSDGKQLTLDKIENPLNQIIEYVNEEGEFGKKEVSFDSKDIYIRVQLHSQSKYIVMQEIGNKSTNFVKTKL